MHLLSLASFLLFAAALGGYAHLFRRRQRERLLRLREADAREGYGADSPRETARLAGYAAVPGRRQAGTLSDWAISIIVQLVAHLVVQLGWVLFFTVMIGIGVILPAAGALKLFHNAGLLTEYPLTPASLFQAVRYAFWTAASLVTLGLLGFRRYGPFLACFLAGLHACSLIAAIIFSSLATMPVQLVVSPLWGIDAWNDWRPFVHLAFVALGVPWAFSICYEARRDLLDDHGDAGYGGYRFRGNPGTALSAGGALFGGLFDGSGGSGDSGGDSD